MKDWQAKQQFILNHRGRLEKLGDWLSEKAINWKEKREAKRWQKTNNYINSVMHLSDFEARVMFYLNCDRYGKGHKEELKQKVKEVKEIVREYIDFCQDNNYKIF